jgi:hypothetical protein
MSGRAVTIALPVFMSTVTEATPLTVFSRFSTPKAQKGQAIPFTATERDDTPAWTRFEERNAAIARTVHALFIFDL